MEEAKPGDHSSTPTDAVPSGMHRSNNPADTSLTESETQDRSESDDRLDVDAMGAGSDDNAACEPLDADALIRRHQHGVWRYLRMLGCDDATADDLTQETFLRILRREDFVQHNENATAGYLRRTAYNLLVSRHRKLGRVQTIAEPKLLDETWDRWAGMDVSGDAAVEALKHCFEKLTQRARLALRMRFDSSASRVEIGEALGITDHGARNLMQRAKQQLRQCVEEQLQLAKD